MEHLTLINITLGLVGIATAFLIRLQSAMNKKGAIPFYFAKWINENWIDLILGVIGTFLGIFFMGSVADIGVTIEGNGEHLHSFLSGLAGQLILSKLKQAVK